MIHYNIGSKSERERERECIKELVKENGNNVSIACISQSLAAQKIERGSSCLCFRIRILLKRLKRFTILVFFPYLHS